ncbi:MAG: FAD-dependent oxidoreductase [Candidatus Nezhaarchaeales archaeon]
MANLMVLVLGLPKAQYDVIVIGAGAAGLTAAMYAASLKLKTLVLEGRNPSRLQLAPTINNYPGFPEGISGAELLRRFREQALKFGAEIRKGDVVAANLIGRVKTITTHEASFTAEAVIIATGIQHAKAGIPGEDRLLGVGVSYCVLCDGPLFRGRKVAVVGDELEAVRDALTMSSIASQTYLASPTGSFNVDPQRLKEVEDRGVKVLRGLRVQAIEGLTMVEGLTVVDPGGNKYKLEVEAVFIASPKVPLTKILAKSGLQTDDKGCIKVDSRMRTNIEGVYAAGDCTCGGFQVSVSVGEGAKAALAAFAYLKAIK